MHRDQIATWRISYKSWLLDLFAILYDDLTARAHDIMSMGIDQGAATSKEDADEISMLQNSINSSTDASTPEGIYNYLESAENGHDYMRRKLNVALAIDAALEPLRLGAKIARGGRAPSKFLRVVSSFYLAEGKGTLNKATTSHSLVVPAELPPLRDGRAESDQRNASGDSLDYLFACLRVVPAQIHHFTVRPVDISHLNEVFRLTAHEDVNCDHLRIAVAPLAELRDDVELDCFDFHGAPRLRVSLNERQREILRTRVQQIVLLASKHSHILVLPEWIVLPEIVQAIKDTMARPEVTESNLLMVVAGTGPSLREDDTSGLPYAECNVLVGPGDCAWTQRKMHHWTIEKPTDYGLHDPAPNRREHFQSARELFVADTPIGRCVILICQDAEEDKPGRDVVRALRPRWVFVPVLDSSLKVGRWSPERAHRLRAIGDSTVAVANSLLFAKDDEVASGKFAAGYIVHRNESNHNAADWRNVNAPWSSPVVLLDTGERPLRRVGFKREG